MQRRTVLVVDDDEAARTMLVRLYRFEGFHVLSAENGDEALECFKQQRPDLVLLDYNLPGKDGLEVLRDLKSLDPTVNVFLMTGADDERLPGLAAQGGATFFRKPLSLVELMSRSRELLSGVVICLETFRLETLLALA